MPEDNKGTPENPFDLSDVDSDISEKMQEFQSALGEALADELTEKIKGGVLPMLRSMTIELTLDNYEAITDALGKKIRAYVEEQDKQGKTIPLGALIPLQMEQNLHWKISFTVHGTLQGLTAAPNPDEKKETLN